MPILKFKNKDGSIQGEFGLVPEYDDRNDTSYDRLIPRNSFVEIQTLSDSEELELLKIGNDNDYKY